MKVNREYRLRDQGDRLLGIEIEMEGQRLQPDSIKYWDMKPDGSLRGEAMEYVLKQPCMLGQDEQRLKTLITALENNRAVLKPSERCGVHIHINCQQLWHTEVLNFVICYLILEDLMAGYCGEDRVGNLFCLRGRDAEYLIDSLCHAAARGSFRGMMTNDLRYSGLNMTSLKKFGSVEFRTLGTPKDLMSITIWIRMLLAIKKFSAQFVEPVEIIESISAGGAVEFLRQALGDDAPMVENGDAEASIMDGIRRVQDIAYMAVKELRDAPPEPMKDKGVIRENGEFVVADDIGDIPLDVGRAAAHLGGRDNINFWADMARDPPPPPPEPVKPMKKKVKRPRAEWDDGINEWVVREVEINQEEDR
jgi:hypothetical protein